MASPSKEDISKFMALKSLYSELQHYLPNYAGHICQQTGFAATLGETNIAHEGDGEYNVFFAKAEAKVKKWDASTPEYRKLQALVQKVIVHAKVHSEVTYEIYDEKQLQMSVDEFTRGNTPLIIIRCDELGNKEKLEKRNETRKKGMTLFVSIVETEVDIGNCPGNIVEIYCQVQNNQPILPIRRAKIKPSHKMAEFIWIKINLEHHRTLTGDGHADGKRLWYIVWAGGYATDTMNADRENRYLEINHIPSSDGEISGNGEGNEVRDGEDPQDQQNKPMNVPTPARGIHSRGGRSGVVMKNIANLRKEARNNKQGTDPDVQFIEAVNKTSTNAPMVKKEPGTNAGAPTNKMTDKVKKQVAVHQKGNQNENGPQTPKTTTAQQQTTPQPRSMANGGQEETTEESSTSTENDEQNGNQKKKRGTRKKSKTKRIRMAEGSNQEEK